MVNVLITFGWSLSAQLRWSAKLRKIFKLTAILPREFIYKKWRMGTKRQRYGLMKREKRQIGAVKNL